MKMFAKYTALLVALLLALAACGPGGTPTATQQAPQPTRTSAPDAGENPTPVGAEPTGEPGTPDRQITIATPPAGAVIGNPIEVTGSVTVSPFEATLLGQVFAADGTLLGQAPIMVDAEMGQPGTFSGSIDYTGDYTGPGKITIAELSANDGSVIVSASVDVTIGTPGTDGGTVDEQEISIATPPAGAVIGNPIEVTGSVAVTPFEATLLGQVFAEDGTLLGEGPIMVDGEMGQPGTFKGTISYKEGYTGPGSITVAELSAKDGSVLASDTVELEIGIPGTDSGGTPETIVMPAAGAKVTLPLHIIAHMGEPGDHALVTLRWQDGTELQQDFTVVEGPDGGGLVIGSMEWQTESMPPQPAERTAALEIDIKGAKAGIALEVLRWDDPEGQDIELHWTLGNGYEVERRRIVKTQSVARAAVEELLWGPRPNNMAGFETALPTLQEVLTYPGREADWGERVTVRGLTIKDGVATVDFSQELRAYGGGAARVTAIREQITRTLKQFDNVEQVVIAIEGQTEGVLEP